MSRRIVAPVLLLVAAALSLAAVFAVQHIESEGGPLAEPWATPSFSPNGDGVQDDAHIRFTTKHSERVTVAVVNESDVIVRTLITNQRVYGKRVITWDGTDADGHIVPEGTYRIHIMRAGDSRIYSPTRPTTVDVTTPVGRLDRATWSNGELRGLALLEPGTKLQAIGPTGVPLEDLHAFYPRPTARSAQPVGPRVRGTVPVRFTVPLDRDVVPLGELRLDAVDPAGNRIDLLAEQDAPTITVEVA